MKKVFSVLLVVLCVSVFAFGDACAKPNKGEKINGVSRMTHSGDIQGTFTLGGCAVEGESVQVLVYIPGISIMAKPLLSDDGTSYSFTLMNVPAGEWDVRLDVFNATTGTATSLTLGENAIVEKQRVLPLGTPEAPVEAVCDK